MSNKKIYIKEEDTLQEVINKIRHNKGKEELMVHVPENSQLKSSLDNFHAIKRESIVQGVDITIESIDSLVLELAALAKIRAINPILGEEEKVFSDIIPKQSNKNHMNNKKENIDSDNHDNKDKYAFLKSSHRKKKNEPKPRKAYAIMRSTKFKFILIVVFLLMFTTGFAAYKILPQAVVELELESTSMDVSDNVLVYTESNNDEEGFDIAIPGEVISSIKNIEMKFPASDSDEVSQRAEGDIYIYNTFTTESVPLVESTRFASPDGMIYRMPDRVVVPGATEVDGELEPSRVKVTVIADEPGEEYNRESVSEEKWTIPGFQEAGLNDFYNGMYAEPVGSLINGFIGETALPSEEDIEMAREETEKSLRNSLIMETGLISSNGLSSIEGTREFTILDESIEKVADEDGEFGIFMEGEMKVFAVEEDSLEHALIESKLHDDQKFNELSQGFNIVESSLENNNIQIDWESGVLTFQTSGSLVVKPKIEEDILHSRLLGKTKSDFRATLFNIPDLSKATISLWPFWVNDVPNKGDKLDIIID